MTPYSCHLRLHERWRSVGTATYRKNYCLDNSSLSIISNKATPFRTRRLNSKVNAVHYYQFNIADYRKDTGHLTLLEHGIYRSMLDTYYLNEKPLCSDNANLMRSHCVRTEGEKEAFKNILKDFFILTKKGYIHKKCDEQISRYAAKSDKARLSAKVRWDAKAIRTHSEGNANHKPITNNQEPKDQKKGRFAPPSISEIQEYCMQRSNSVDAKALFDHYEANGWFRGKTKIKNWKACVHTWEKKATQEKQDSQPTGGHASFQTYKPEH